MAFDYLAAQQTADRLIALYGADGTISRVTTVYDPETGVDCVTEVVTGTAKMVNLPASSGTVQAFDNRFIEAYKKGEIRFFYVSAIGLLLPPEAGDLVVFNGEVMELAGATPLNPAGIPVFYTMGTKVSALSELPKPFYELPGA